MLSFKNDEEVAEAGERIRRAEYWETVRAIAREALERHPDDDDAQREAVWESVDGSSYVIYYRESLLALLFTENDDAYEDVYGDIASMGDADFGRVLSVVAFCAMNQDALEELERLRREAD